MEQATHFCDLMGYLGGEVKAGELSPLLQWRTAPAVVLQGISDIHSGGNSGAKHISTLTYMGANNTGCSIHCCVAKREGT